MDDEDEDTLSALASEKDGEVSLYSDATDYNAEQVRFGRAHGFAERLCALILL